MDRRREERATGGELAAKVLLQIVLIIIYFGFCLVVVCFFEVGDSLGILRQLFGLLVLSLVLFPLTAVIVEVPDNLGARGVAIVWLLVAVTLSVAALFEVRLVWFCFLAATCWSLGLFCAKSAFRRPSPVAGLIHRGLRVALILTAVSGGLWALSFRLSEFPPDHILVSCPI